jgi:ferrous iron transport protein A
VPGTRITTEFASPGGDPAAYLIRGALIALRRTQAELIQVDLEPARAAS